ncbi:unnamed protein product, partial [Ectocarpus sp. 6 AP-2014]
MSPRGVCVVPRLRAHHTATHHSPPLLLGQPAPRSEGRQISYFPTISKSKS